MNEGTAPDASVEESSRVIEVEINETMQVEQAEVPAPPCHVMLDLETLGQGNKAALTSIGACKFTTSEILDSFHVAIDPGSCQNVGLEIDASTVMWWFAIERREALDRWLRMEKLDIASALLGFSIWLGVSPSPVAIWGNGSTFDNIILRSAYQACGMEYPVKFWQDQCYRTMKYRAPTIKLIREGTHHDALDDARSQAKHLQQIMHFLGVDQLGVVL